MIDEPALNLRHSNIPYAAVDLTHRMPPVHSAGKGARPHLERVRTVGAPMVTHLKFAKH